MGKSLGKNKSIIYAKIAGILLIITGIGQPIVGFLVLYIGTIPKEVDAQVALGVSLLIFASIFIPIWIISIIGGIMATIRTHYHFVVISCVISLLYWFPFFGIIATSSAWGGDNIFLLYVPLLILPIPALVLLLLSKKWFY
jgi:hypothetical protein